VYTPIWRTRKTICSL